MSDPDSSGQAGDSGPEPEQLLAEALRAQARSAPGAPGHAGGHESAEPAASPSIGPPPGYGLLSGADAGSLERERAALEATGPSDADADAATAHHDSVRKPDRRLPAGWVLLLAVLLGLAAGAVVGLLTLL